MDWGTAASVGRRLAKGGPKVTTYTWEQARAELVAAAATAEKPVREVTGLADGLAVPVAQALDRKEWVTAATSSMSAMLGEDGDSPTGLSAITARVGGVQAGGLLAVLSSAILGQYDPFSIDPVSGELGVLLLVTPNIIATERALHVVPQDFRLWVCLHEVTHRVQFSANPWLRDYMLDNIAVLTRDTGESSAEIIARLTAAVRSDRPREKGVLGMMQLLQTPEQYDAFTRMMMLGTLLEGHADHVMDAVGPDYVPSVERIREAFDQRRQRPQNPVQRLLRALMGMDAKLAQYIRGKAFVDEVVEKVGMSRFNTVWSNPHTLPRPDEIDEPQRWIDRVL
ncbi:zinc-dependent metalloprotease [Gordonia jinhuaensis]|uniref:Hydrolase n=1 Tax=Gordonia jinhuaensis TaxID=1517702 RepID=A0A916TD24_9ACTN|nr:hydrolase [Gordonia jinhuaensis]